MAKIGAHLLDKKYKIFIVFLFLLIIYLKLDQEDSRFIYANWDKLLHSAVFFCAWWLLRWAGGDTLIVSVSLVFLGGLEEFHQIFSAKHHADILDWMADVIGVVSAYVSYCVFLLSRKEISFLLCKKRVDCLCFFRWVFVLLLMFLCVVFCFVEFYIVAVALRLVV